MRLAWGRRVCVAEKQPLRLDGEPCVYRYAIGADGQSSRVRQSIGLGQGKILSRRFGTRCHYRVKPWSSMVEVHWGDLGQAYITPVGPEEICVATVARDSRHQDGGGPQEACPALRAHLEGADELSTVRGALTTTRKLRRVTAGKRGSYVGTLPVLPTPSPAEGLALSFRQALLLAEAIAVDNLAIYEAGHPAILRMPHLMSRVMLRMDAWRLVREGALALLSAQPQLFSHLLAVHLGERSCGDFLLRDLPALGFRLLPLSGFAIGDDRSHRAFPGFLSRKTTPRDLCETTVIAKPL